MTGNKDAQIRTYEEPTNEQLAHFALVLAYGPGRSESEIATAVSFLEASPVLRDEWLRRHREFQEAAWNL